ncbi:MAG: hypothetical protein HY954_05350 [Deltaproteobacteria bacterium]|nr:hypothetical protein [Deltaproteobacteria bacterium]
MRRTLLIALLLMSATANAEDCTEHALLHDIDYFKNEYHWSQGRIEIKMWESPALITVVGKLMPSSHVTILEKAADYYRVKASDEQGGMVGWIHKAQVETIIRNTEDTVLCY